MMCIITNIFVYNMYYNVIDDLMIAIISNILYEQYGNIA